MSDENAHSDMLKLSTMVATLAAQMVARTELMERIEKDQKDALKHINDKLDRIDQTVNGAGGHGDWIKARKRDGWWLGSGLIGLGAILSAAFDWWKDIPPPT